MSGNWPEGVGQVILPEADSTNLEAARRASSLPGPTWILALRQTQGRGRRGRDWHDPEGNFAATYVMRPDAPIAEVAQRSFVAALALHEALVAVTGREGGFALKWPNDVLLNGGKLAGILLESLGHGSQIRHLAIGIGVNLRAAPVPDPDSVAPVSLLGETGLSVTPQAFLASLAPAFARWDAQLVAYGFDPIRRAWLERAARLGQPMTARMMDRVATGTFEGIDATGALQLRTAEGLRAIPAADVFFA